MPIWLIVLIAVVVLVLLWLVVTYNGLVKLRNKVENAWAQIDVQLKRRLDLIPNLVETVKGYAAHESSTLEAVIQARQASIAAIAGANAASTSAATSSAPSRPRASSPSVSAVKPEMSDSKSAASNRSATGGTGTPVASRSRRCGGRNGTRSTPRLPGLSRQSAALPAVLPTRCAPIAPRLPRSWTPCTPPAGCQGGGSRRRRA